MYGKGFTKKNNFTTSSNIVSTWPFSCIYLWYKALCMTIEYWSKCNFNVIVGFFVRVQKIAVRTEQSGLKKKTKPQHSRVRNNLAGCGAGLANLTVFLSLSFKLLQKWQIDPKTIPGDSQLSAFPHRDCDDVDWRWGWVSESNTYPQLRLTLSSRKYTELSAFCLTGNHQQIFKQ